MIYGLRPNRFIQYTDRDKSITTTGPFKAVKTGATRRNDYPTRPSIPAGLKVARRRVNSSESKERCFKRKSSL